MKALDLHSQVRSQIMKLSVVMPIYNERNTLRSVIQRVLSVPLDIELLCVDDGSSDGSTEILSELRAEHENLRFFLQPHNMGKGDVVYGSRFLGSGPHRVLYFWHSVGNWILTLLSNCLTNINLSDMETCYKAFRREVIQSIPIEENRFGFEPEITVKVAKRKLRIYEVGISYWGRTYEEGKKIGWKDGVQALWCLLKYSIKEPAKAPESALQSAQVERNQKLATTETTPPNDRRG